jgi:hypothetical protein
MGFGSRWVRFFAQSATAVRALTSSQGRLLGMLALFVAVAIPACRSRHRRTPARAAAAGLSTLDGGILVIVARHRPDLYADLSRAFWGSTDVRIVLDRRGDPLIKRGRRPWRGSERRSPLPDGDGWAGSGVKVVVSPRGQQMASEPRKEQHPVVGASPLLTLQSADRVSEPSVNPSRECRSV